MFYYYIVSKYTYNYNKFDFSHYLFDDKIIVNENNNCAVKSSDKFNLTLGYCLACGKKLVLIGSNRGNGSKGFDWGSRKYHKKCL